MPTYEYACKDCGQGLEVVQKFSDDALTVCPSCQGKLRKVLHAPGISFKGSGFYKNDSRSSSGSSTAPAAESNTDKPSAPDAAPSKGTDAAKPAAESTKPKADSAPSTKKPDSTVS